MRLLDCERFNDDTSPLKERVALDDVERTDLGYNDNGQLNKVRCADPTNAGIVYHSDIKRRLGLSEKNSDKRGSINDHFGRPCSS